MYPYILFLHSLLRWFVLISLLFAIFRGYAGWITRRPFSKFDDLVRHSTATIVHLQFVAGCALYVLSPLISYFLHHFKEAVHERQIRFFGMEHSSMMLLAVVVISIGSAKAKRKATDPEKYKTMAIWFTIGLLILLSSIPWWFSPLVNRPAIRPLPIGHF